jgi:hypothetical protein
MIRKQAGWIILIVLAVAIKIFSLFPDAVEKYYSNGMYLVTAKVQRFLFGWIPFSVGDVLYLAIILFLVYKLVDMIRRLRKRQADKKYWLATFRRVVLAALLVYVSFNLLWGLNYNRRGIAHQLGISRIKVTKEELLPVMQVLMKRVNQFDSLGKINRGLIADKNFLFDGSAKSYAALANSNKKFVYASPSIKSSLFSYLGNYLGYTGYYNPFSGEAQVNRAVPLFIQPFTTCHEIGHQLGFAKENEANFAGFLSAKSSNDPLFLYSVYFEMYSYGRPYLYLQDSTMLRQLDAQLRPGVKKDLRELKEFYIRHANPIEKVIDKLYGQYLKANEQPEGKFTYSQVIVWLIAYAKVNGRQAL